MIQTILVRDDLDMDEDEIIKDIVWASVNVSNLLPQHKIERWIDDKNSKIDIIKVSSINELLKCQKRCEEKGLKTYAVVNTNEQSVSVGTITCLAIGPYERGKQNENWKYLD